MSKEELLKTEFNSACDAMNALANFLDEVDNSSKKEDRGKYQNLRVIGNRVFE